MLCNLIEKSKSKCIQYWPDNKLKPKIFKSFKVDFISENEVVDKMISERKFLINNKSEKFEVTQLHYKGWPDHGVPDVEKTYTYFTGMFNYVLNTGDSSVVCHCSAGIGRTGTFISSYILWKQLTDRYNYLKNIEEKKEICLSKSDFKFSIFKTVLKAKNSRCYSVENVKQYEFIYNLVKKIIKSLK